MENVFLLVLLNQERYTNEPGPPKLKLMLRWTVPVQYTLAKGHVAAAGVSKLLRHAPTPLLCALSSNFNEIFLGRSRVNLSSVSL